MRHIKIFVASSKELEDERRELVNLINTENKDWVNKGLFLHLVQWEDFLDVMSTTRSQDEYNKAVLDCHLFVLLFFSKMGKYTHEEFEKAHQHFKKTGKPLILTYFKKGLVANDDVDHLKNAQSLDEFKAKLRALEHFPTVYETLGDLKSHFLKQLDKIDFEALLKPAFEIPTVSLESRADTFRALHPEALNLCIEKNETVTIYQPHQNEGEVFTLPKQGFSANVANILQRFMPDTELEDSDFRVLGEALFRRLLPNQVARDRFAQAYLAFETNKKENECLKIVLHFDAKSSDLAALPWEYLYVPASKDTTSIPKGFFIGEKDDLLLIRRLPGSLGQPTAIQPARVRILTVISKPEPTEESKGMQDEAEELVNRFDLDTWKKQHPGLAPPEFTRVVVTSKEEFEKVIAGNAPFHVVHFIGKATTIPQPDGSETNHFLFASGQKLSPQNFVACFDLDDGTSKKPNLLFLHAIRDSRESTRSLRKMAMELVNKVDGVLAIQLPAGSDEIAEFAMAFYTALAAGQDLDTATARAARDLVKKTTNRLRSYGISASFSRDSFKIVVEQKQISAAKPTETFFKCPNTTVQKNNEFVCDPNKSFLFNTTGVCYCLDCDAGPLYPCPLCLRDPDLDDQDRYILTDLTKKRCFNGHEISDFWSEIPERIRKAVERRKSTGPAAAAGGEKAAAAADQPPKPR